MSGIYLGSYEFILTKTHNLFSYGWVFILWASFLERCSECRSVTHAQHCQVETLPLLGNWHSDRRNSETSSSESGDLQLFLTNSRLFFSLCFLSHIMAMVKFYSYSATVFQRHWKHLNGYNKGEGGHLIFESGELDSCGIGKSILSIWILWNSNIIPLTVQNAGSVS